MSPGSYSTRCLRVCTLGAGQSVYVDMIQSLLASLPQAPSQAWGPEARTTRFPIPARGEKLAPARKPWWEWAASSHLESKVGQGFPSEATRGPLDVRRTASKPPVSGHVDPGAEIPDRTSPPKLLCSAAGVEGQQSGQAPRPSRQRGHVAGQRLAQDTQDHQLNGGGHATSTFGKSLRKIPPHTQETNAEADFDIKCCV